VVIATNQKNQQNGRFVDTSLECPYNAGSLHKANPIQMNIFGAQSLPASPVSAGSDWDTPRFPA